MINCDLIHQKKIKIILSFLLLTQFQSCATSSFKEEMIRNMAISAALGFAVGTSQNQNVKGYGYQYAGLAAAGAALVTTIYKDPDAEIKKVQDLNKTISDSIENAVTQKNTVKTISSGASLNGVQQLPPQYKSKIKLGEWKLSQIDEWEQVDDYTFIHKTELFEIKPPEFKTE